VNYWKTELDNLPAEPMTFPFRLAEPKPGKMSLPYFDIELSKELTAQLRKLNGQAGTSTFMSLMAIFSAYVGRHAQATDILIASPRTNRHQSQMERVIGHFGNMNLFRYRVDFQKSFRNLLSQARATTLNGFHHSLLPAKVLEKIVKKDTSNWPQQLFINMNPPKEEPVAGGVRFLIDRLDIKREFDIQEVTYHYFSWFPVEAGGQIGGSLQYNSMWFESPVIEQFVRGFIEFVDQLVRAPDAPIADIKLAEIIVEK